MVASVAVATCRIGDIVRPPQGALLAVSPRSLKDSAAYGSTAPRANVDTVKNTGDGELKWHASLLHGSPWATLDPDTGTAGESPTLQVFFHPTGLEIGQYADTVLVEANAGGGTEKVPLSFQVHSCITNSIRLDDSISTSLTTADCGAPHRPGRFAKLFLINSATVNDSLTIDVTASYDAYVAFDTSLAPTAPPFRQNDNCLGAGTDPCLYYVRLPRNGNFYVEVTSADSADTGAFKVRVLHPRLPNLPDSLDQRLATDSTVSIAAGDTIGQASVMLRAVVSDPDLGDTLHLEAEVRPVNTPFSQAPTAVGTVAVPNGSPAYVLQSGLSDTTSYHWQIHAVDQTGRSSKAWKAFPGNPAFIVQTGHDPNPPTSLGQLQGDGTTAIPVGDTAVSTTVKFTAVVNDQDATDVLHLEVEVEPINVAFTGTPSLGAPTSSGSGATDTVTVTAPTLLDGQDYHWQARTVDNTGRRSTWVSFGGNTESATDFHVTVASNFNLVFSVQPTQATAGVAIAPAVKVTATNQFGQTITSFTGNVTMAIASGPAGFSPSASTSATANSGVATFSNLIINKAGAYTLVASALVNSSTIFSPPSNSFNVVPAAVTQLAFTLQPPASTTAGVAMNPGPQVSAEDQFGNVNPTFTSSVTMALAAPSPSGDTLSGTKSVPATAGVATFGSLRVRKTGNGYMLVATRTGLTPDTSVAFNITPAPPTHLAFAVQPTTAAANQPIAPPIQVAARDSLENLATSFGGNVSLTITGGTGTAGAVLSGGGAVAANSGTAQFSSVSIDRTGTNYTLTAAATGLTSAISAQFNITNAQISSTLSTVVASPSTITASSGTSQTTITVTAMDVNNAIVSGAQVTLTVLPSGGVTLNPSTSRTTDVNGIATWTMSSTVAAVDTVKAIINSVTIAQQPLVTVTPGSCASLLFTQAPPASVTAGVVMSPAPAVTCRDAFNNTATGFTGNVTMALNTNPSGDTLSGTKVVPAAGGTATFTNIRVRKTGTNYTLRASATGVSSVNSTSFSVTPAPAVRDTFTVEPTTTQVAPAVINSPTGVLVTIVDSIGNTVTSATNSITVSLLNPPVPATLGGTKTKNAVNGVVTYNDLTIDKVGTGFTLNTTASGLVPDVSAPFNITPGPVSATTSSISASPVTITACSTGCSVPSTQSTITVIAKDAGGNVIQGDTVLLAATGSFNNLVQPTGPTNSSGIATGAISSKKAETKTLSATINGTPINATFQVTVTPGPAASMQFTKQPTSTTSGAILGGSGGVQVTAFDAFGNVATGFSGSVTVSITTGTGAGGAKLNGTKSVAAISGVATFTDLSIDKVGNNYTLTAVATGPSSATSQQFNITAGTPTKVAFIAQPTSTTGGATISTVQVEIEDLAGNRVTTATNTVTLGITSGTGTAGASLNGTTSTAAVNGVATFSTLSIDSAGTGYTLTAASGPLTPDTSSSFSITVGTAAKLGFLTQPSNATGGATITPAVQVEVRDLGGNRVTSASNSITVAIGTNPKNGSLGGTKTVSASSGVATFSTLSIDSAAIGYTLTASATGLTGATSNTFNITVGSAAKLGFHVQPSNTTAGATISPAVQVEVQDAGGNRVTTATNSIFMAIANNAGGGTLFGTTPVTAVNGLATFSNLSIDKIGTGYTLGASATGLTGATSAPFNITGGTATKLAFFVQPSNATGGATISPAVQVEVEDAGGNRVTTATNSITLAIGTNAGPNAVLWGTNPVGAVNGVATFSNLSIDSAGTGYTLTAIANGLTGATSNTFNIAVGSAAKLGFLVQPSNATGGATITPAVQVEVRDLGGNRVTSASNSITVAIGTNPNNGSLGGTKTLSASSGVATFNDLSIDSAATGYTLTASATGLTGATSNTFNITVGSAAKLGFHVQPTDTRADSIITPAVVVEVQDAGGNRVTNATDQVTMDFGTNAGGGVLSGTLQVSAVAGLATFSDLSINNPANGYTLAASATNRTGATSATFRISP